MIIAKHIAISVLSTALLSAGSIAVAEQDYTYRPTAPEASSPPPPPAAQMPPPMAMQQQPPRMPPQARQGGYPPMAMQQQPQRMPPQARQGGYPPMAMQQQPQRMPPQARQGGYPPQPINRTTRPRGAYGPPSGYRRGPTSSNSPWGGRSMPWGGGRNSSPWGGGRSMPWGGGRNSSPWGGNRMPMGNFDMPFDMGGGDMPWDNSRKWVPDGKKRSVWGKGPKDWLDPDDPKEGLADAWDDLLNAPAKSGRMPGGWYAPEISVPNPVDVADEFEDAGVDMPKEMRKQSDNFEFN